MLEPSVGWATLVSHSVSPSGTSGVNSIGALVGGAVRRSSAVLAAADPEGPGNPCISALQRRGRRRRSPVEGRASQYVFGLGLVPARRLPRPNGPVAHASPVALTAARQFRIHTGFPDT